MKKVLFLMLFLLVLGVANINSQVRIGGDGEPNEAAVLDLNADDDTNDGTKGLALPRVSLSSNTAILAGATSNLNGMLVYNTGGTLTAGVYFWDVNRWRLLRPDGVWRTAWSCAACASLAVAGSLTLTWAELGTPPWATYNNCWVNPATSSNFYIIHPSADGVLVRKHTATSATPYFMLMCWGPLD